MMRVLFDHFGHFECGAVGLQEVPAKLQQLPCVFLSHPCELQLSSADDITRQMMSRSQPNR